MRGSILALTDNTGNIAETYSYDPFGMSSYKQNETTL